MDKKNPPKKPRSREPKQIKEMKQNIDEIAKSYVPSKGNTTWLVIVESPSKCKKFEEYLGSEYKCIATMGHLQYIEGLNAIETGDNSFHIQYSVIPEKTGHIQQMRRIISAYSSNRVLIATDDDREGEAIAWHILTLFHLPPDTPRIKFHEITKTALQNAVKFPTVVNQLLVQSQQARQVIDMLIGFKISPLLWKYVCQSKKDALSAGRCQTVALRLIYENDCLSATEQSTGEKLWKTTGAFTHKNFSFTYSKTLNETDLLMFYKNVQLNPYYSFSSKKHGNQKILPPKPLTTARLLQQYTSISPSQVMSLCQILYQEGFITYMRTDSENYSVAFLKHVQEYFNRVGFEFGEENPCCSKVEKAISGPHEAIRVTCLDTTSYCDKTEDKEKNAKNRSLLNSLYHYIWKNTAQSCMPSAEFENVDITAISTDTHISHPNDGVFKYTIEIPTKFGWMAFGKTREELTQQATVQKTTELFFESIISKRGGNKNPCLKLNSTPITERQPKHYSEASLISQLEKKGIGRPSTYAYLIETIIERGYVKKTDIEGTKTPCCHYSLDLAEKATEPQKNWVDVWLGKEQNKLVIQTVGIMTMEFLANYFDPLFSYNYTREMEGELDKIADGQTTKQAVCLHCQKNISEAAIPLKTVEKRKLPKIDNKYDFMILKFGNVLRQVLEDGTVEYFPVKNIKLDLSRLNTVGGYSATELLEFPDRTNYLGKYRGEDVVIQKGPYGWYIQYMKKHPVANEENESEQPSSGSISIPTGCDIHNICLEDAISWIEQKENPSPQPTDKQTTGNEREPPSQKSVLLRTLDSSCSIRNGKFGPFIMLLQEPTGKRKTTKAQFYSLKKFTGDYLTCSKNDLLRYVETL